MRRISTVSLVAMTLCLAVLAVFAPPMAAAQEQAEAPAKIPDTPRAAAPDRQTAVSIEHLGVDNLGSRLVLRLREICNTSSLFSLSDKDEKKIRLIVATKDEFPDRPGMSSAYSVTWLYSETEGTLKYYLSTSLGFINAATVDGEAETLAKKTDGVSAKYSYLFD